MSGGGDHGSNRERGAPADDAVARLSRLFQAHPAWLAAAGHIADGSASNVYFRDRPGEVWCLTRRGGATHLEPGCSNDPDFVFRFGPASVDRLEAVTGGVADFAIALFRLIEDDCPESGIEFRVAAPWWRLWRRGYARLLLEAGPRVWAFGARRGVRSWRALRGLVADSLGAGPFDWER
ncbi:MAG: hypothetical protein ACQGVK_08580 [Myxococcota bacterium]